MERVVCTLVFIFSMLSMCFCSSGIGLMHKSIRNFNKKLNNFKIELVQMDTNLQDSIDIAKESMRLELTQHIKQQLNEAMAEFRGGESAGGSRHVDSEIRRLKQGHQQTKRQLHSVMKTLRDVQQEKDMYRDALEKAESCSKCHTDNKLLESVLKHCNLSDERTKLKINSRDKGSTNTTILLEKLNSTCKYEKEQSSSTPTSSTTTTTTTTPPTTSIPVHQTPVMNRLIIAGYGSRKLSQLNLHTKSLSKYSLTVPGGVSSLCYIQKLGRLLVGTWGTKRITSTTLDGDDTQTLREDVDTTGMAVDEGRQLVFMTTWRPQRTISRMSTRGGNFTVIRVLSDEYFGPSGIAVNTRDRVLYVSSDYRVFKLSYTGKHLQSLASGVMYGVTFDAIRYILYFNDGRTLKKMSMSDEVVSDVTTLSVTQYTLSYYNNTVFYGGIYGTRYVGAVQLGEKPVNTRLQTMSSDYNDALIICLVP